MYACSKDNATTPAKPPSLVGLWVGTYTADNENVGNLYESFDLKADSTVQVQSQGADGNTYYGSGTWSVSGTSFTTTYTENNLGNAGKPATFTGAWNASTMQISGNWQTPTHDASGAFEVTLVP